MRVRHLIAAADVDEYGLIHRPELARHGVVVAGRIAALAGMIDRLTHLNLDFSEHLLGDCIIAERLEVGAMVLSGPDGFLTARPLPTAYDYLGPVDLDARRVAWLQRVHHQSMPGR